MSEEQVIEAPIAAEPVVVSAGKLLREAREAQGLHIAALAVSLKVPVKKIEALEADRHDSLPDAVFIRGLASSVCRALKIDPTPILAKLPQTNAPRLNQAEVGINAPFRSPSDGPSASLFDQLSKPAALAVLALLLGALVLIFLPDFQRNLEVSGQIITSVSPPALPVSTSAEPVALAGNTLVPSVPTSSQTLAQSPSPSGAILAGAAAMANDTSTAGASPVLTSSSKLGSVTVVMANASTDGVVAFKTRGESWVEVIDADGKTILRRNLIAGEAAGVNGSLPFKVTVGRADQTQVLVRGKPFNTDDKVRDNVARFEVR